MRFGVHQHFETIKFKEPEQELSGQVTLQRAEKGFAAQNGCGAVRILV